MDETYVHDPSSVIYFLNPEYFTFLPFPLTVETEGIDRGRVIVDDTRFLSRKGEIKVALDVNRRLLEGFLADIEKYL